MADLLQSEGPILQRVKLDDTLQLAIRNGYINIYYRGGNLLRLTEQGAGFYTAEFDQKYNKFSLPLPALPVKISRQAEVEQWVAAFPALKTTMDFWFSRHRKAEREFQQLVARENNHSIISNQSEYFVTDIEFADPTLGARFDLLAIRWLAAQRKTGNHCRPVLIEMKYGDGALSGSAGILKHLEDIDALLADEVKYATLLEMMVSQFNQLDELGLLNFNRGVSDAKIELTSADKPEVVFLLANHNPRSTKLRSILSDPQVALYAASERFELRFFAASFAGYGMHADCMLDLAAFMELL